MGNGKDRDHLVAILVGQHDDDGAGAVFDAFVPPGRVFTHPQIAIPDDEAGGRCGQRHRIRTSVRD